ncbi:hypothetical protein T439DRAFT_383423 [Meredithblackwellia eburnea MCA 4105]
MAAVASTSRLARSPTPDVSTGDDLTPLGYDSEEELLDIFQRLRDDLKKRCREACKGKSKAELEKTEKKVLEDFFDRIVPSVLANCTIAGQPYQKYKQREVVPGETKPYLEDLHEQVLVYQNQLFTAREENVQARKDVPKNIETIIKQRLEEDSARIAKIEERVRIEFPERTAPKPKARKSLAKGVTPDAPTPQETHESFAQAKSDLDWMLNTIPVISTNAEGATKVIMDLLNSVVQGNKEGQQEGGQELSGGLGNLLQKAQDASKELGDKNTDEILESVVSVTSSSISSFFSCQIVKSSPLTLRDSLQTGKKESELREQYKNITGSDFPVSDKQV